jgi:hypothetical protein
MPQKGGELVDRSTSQHNYPYLTRVHTPTYSPVHDDHRILVIDEVAATWPN